MRRIRRKLRASPGIDREVARTGRAGGAVGFTRVAGISIPPNYDSMIGKLIVHWPTRTEAIAVMRRSVSEFQFADPTTIPLHLQIMDNLNFQTGKWIPDLVERVMLGK